MTTGTTRTHCQCGTSTANLEWSSPMLRKRVGSSWHSGWVYDKRAENGSRVSFEITRNLLVYIVRCNSQSGRYITHEGVACSPLESIFLGSCEFWPGSWEGRASVRIPDIYLGPRGTPSKEREWESIFWIYIATSKCPGPYKHVCIDLTVYILWPHA